MKKRTSKSLSAIMAAIMLIAAMVVPAAATMSIEEQMAANSAAWHIANAAGDTQTCEALHAANVALAEQAAGSSGSASYDEASGTWDITTEDGSNISSSGSYSGGKSNTITYTNTSSDGDISSTSNTAFTGSAIDAYMENGGSHQGLIDGYNNAAYNASSTGNYGTSAQTTSAQQEAAVIQELYGLSDSETAELQASLEASKQEYALAQAAYNAAIASGDAEAAAAARAQMDAAHQSAEDTRSEYNYSGDSYGYEDGGYFNPNYNPSPSYYYDDYPIVIPSVTYYSISASAGNGGSISPSGTTSVRRGDSQSYSISPSAGYEISNVKVDGASMGAISSYTFSNVTSNHSISATFVKKTFTISATAGNGGSITPSGTTSVNSGDSLTYAIIPNTGYEIASVKVDGINKGAISSYTFSNVTSNHSISATFVKKTFTISASAGVGGSISPAGTIQVTHGESRSFSILPDWGYKVKSVIVDGVDKGAVGGYSFSYVNGNHTISVIFEPSGEIGLDEPVVTDDTGLETDGSGIKSGYGIFASVDVTYSGVTDVKLTMTYDFGFGEKTVVLEETGRFVFEYPVNSQSPLGKRCVYIPVETLDGTYTLTFTLTAKNVEGEVLTETSTATVVVRGNMYEDDFTGDS